MRILYINDDPTECLIREGFAANDVEIELIVAKTAEKAREHLLEAASLDLVFMDYDLGRGRNRTSVAIGLVQDFVDAGFGKGRKMLLANSRENRSNEELMEAGCSHICSPNEVEQFVRTVILKK